MIEIYMCRSAEIEIGHDCTEADLEELVRKNWEAADPGRAERAAAYHPSYYTN